MKYSGIASLLERAVAGGAERRAYTGLVDGRDEGRVLSYGELYRLAGQGATLLRDLVKPGERVLLLQDDTLEFMACFLACLFARVVAVPIPPPDAARLKRTLPRVQGVVADCGATAVLASARGRDHLQHSFAEVSGLAHLPWLTGADFAAAESSEPLAVAPDELAYLQYSSGSTAQPKGVMMSHANLLDNLRLLQRGFAYDGDSTTVTWMPYFHDYGLVDGLLQPLYSQVPCYVMSPVSFIKRPWRWLEAVSRFRATHTHGPNFAYQMCLDRMGDDKLAGLDLSSLRTAGCGAEPVRRDTVERFIERFAPCGFRREAFVPAYGLAEATLIVTSKRPGTLYRTAFLAPEEQGSQRCIDIAPEHPQARAVLSCGVTPEEFDLVIADPQSGAELPEDTAGEIWVGNASVAGGYWNRPEETRAAFQARTPSGRGPMLRTGDLGFLRDGELYVTGRIKDIIIINGTNHYPQDIELSVEGIGPWVRSTCVAAFSVEMNGEERLVVAAELDGRLDDPPGEGAALLDAIRAAVSLQHEIACAAIVLLTKGSLPKTSSGKIQRGACRSAFLHDEWAPLAAWREAERPVVHAAAPPVADHGIWEDLVRQVVAQRKGLDGAAIGALEPFANFGISSRVAVEIAAALEDASGKPVPATVLWEYPNVRALAAFLAGSAAAPSAVPATGASGEAIAVIGMACRFPGGADSPQAFWALINGGGSAICAPPPQRFAGATPDFRAGFVERLFEFDAAFFGISDEEALTMDPQQRLLLATAWHALEDAGLTAEGLAGTDTGVYVGVSATDYAQQVYAMPGEPSRYGATGTSAAIVANRLSYFLDLHGPSLAIDTACSASLVAVHQACAALRDGDCGIALAGGVNVLLSAPAVATLQKAEMLSPSGQCRPFDAAADGYVRGEGCGVVVLKTLSRARRDGDAVLAVIRGSAVLQDGRSNGLTAPNGAAQRQVIGKALARAGIAAPQVGYVEAHGTSTPLGDPLELRALADCYGSGELPCRVGAVKAHIGHLEGAAGIAGLIKTLLVLRHDTIPGNPFLENPNPRADVSATRLAVARAAQPWPDGARRIAAVSSFGFGGTLAHLIVEGEPAASSETSPNADPQLLLLSAPDSAALARLAESYAAWPGWQDAGLAAVCATAALKRTLFPCRAAYVASDAAGMTAALRVPAGSAVDSAGAAPLAFLFTGQGAQRDGMGRGLYRRFAAFRAALDEVDGVLRAELGMSAEDLLFSLPGESANNTRYAQPLLLLLQLGLLRVWESWGVRPAVVLGHSVGEFAAAVAAGVLSPVDAVRLIVARGRLMDEACGPGGMAALQASPAQAEVLIGESGGGLVVAARNAPQRVTVSGDAAAIQRLLALCEARQVAALALPVERAFHSPAMEPARQAYAAAFANVALHEPRVTMLSSVTGTRAGAEIATPEYWLRQITEPVNFSAAVGLLPECQVRVAMEIGPSAPLCGLGDACLGGAAPHWVASLSAREAEDATLLAAAGSLFVHDVALRREGLFTPPAAPLAGLPLYPFGGKEYRVAGVVPNAASLPQTYISQWQAAEPSSAATSCPRCLLVGDPDCAASQRLANALGGSPGAGPVMPLPWQGLAGVDPGTDHPLVLLHCLPRDGENPADAATRLTEALLAALRALRHHAGRCRVWAITHGSVPQDADETMSVAGACVWGAGRVAALEMPELWGGLIDLAADFSGADAALLARIVSASSDEDQWTVRGGKAFVARLAASNAPAGWKAPVLRGDAVYWVVGGAGALGRHALRALREMGARHLLVSGRQAGEPPQLAEPEFATFGVRYFQADVANPADVARVLAGIDALGLPLAGIVHAAGTASEYPIEQLDSQRFREVAAAKVQGAWNLHTLTQGRPLQFFVCFASIAGLWGSAGQAHYAAANHFLDALCDMRRRAGLAGLALDWGPWSGGGLVSAEVEARLVKGGLDLLPPERALALFKVALGADLARIAAVDVRWAAFSGAYTARRASPFLAALAPAVSETAAPAPRLTGTPAQVRAEITRRVAAAVENQLGAGRAAEVQRGFFDLGLDSLAVVAIHKRLVGELGIAFPRPDMFNYASIAALSERLFQLWAQEQAPPAPAETPAEQLSGAEIAARIEAEMAALGLKD